MIRARMSNLRKFIGKRNLSYLNDARTLLIWRHAHSRKGYKNATNFDKITPNR